MFMRQIFIDKKWFIAQENRIGGLLYRKLKKCSPEITYGCRM